MKINKFTWRIFSLLAMLGIFFRFKFSYPQIVIVNFSIDRAKAVFIAKEYLRELNVDVDKYKTASVYGIDGKC